MANVNTTDKKKLVNTTSKQLGAIDMYLAAQNLIALAQQHDVPKFRASLVQFRDFFIDPYGFESSQGQSPGRSQGQVKATILDREFLHGSMAILNMGIFQTLARFIAKDAKSVGVKIIVACDVAKILANMLTIAVRASICYQLLASQVLVKILQQLHQSHLLDHVVYAMTPLEVIHFLDGDLLDLFEGVLFMCSADEKLVPSVRMLRSMAARIVMGSPWVRYALLRATVYVPFYRNRGRKLTSNPNQSLVLQINDGSVRCDDEAPCEVKASAENSSELHDLLQRPDAPTVIKDQTLDLERSWRHMPLIPVLLVTLLESRDFLTLSRKTRGPSARQWLAVVTAVDEAAALEQDKLRDQMLRFNMSPDDRVPTISTDILYTLSACGICRGRLEQFMKSC
jgi:hypothetical protein